VFQANPRTGDRRVSGTAAALCGLDAARDSGDEEQVEVAIRRLLTLYSVVYSFGGIPLLYMGDELGLANDPAWAADPAQAGDNRWMHRPVMDWAAADRRHDPAGVEGRVFAGIQRLARTRAGLLALRSGTSPELLDVGDRQVLAYRRRHARSGPLVALASFSDDPVEVDRGRLADLPRDAAPVVATQGSELTTYALRLPAWGHAWLAGD
jgi:amylosucrase